MRKMLKLTGIAALLVVIGLGVSSCGKQEPTDGGATPEAKTEANDTVKTTPEAQAAAGGLVAIPLVLPKPQFVGTPTNIEGITNLEPKRGTPREKFLAPAGVTNVALGKPVSSSVDEPIMGELTWLVDGDKEATDGSLIELDPFVQHVTVDLEAEHEIYAVVFWHYHKQARVYLDVIVQVSDSQDFIDVQTVFNNDDDNSAEQGVGTDMNYVEVNEGKLVDAKGVKGRYVRLYSQGNNSNDQNHYLEVEVYARPIQ